MARKSDVGVIDPTEPTPSNRTRAAKLRAMLKAGGMLAPEEAAWLADYEEARQAKADERAGIGASRGRRVSYTEEEHEAVGEGSAAAEAAAAGAMVREEGRRYDSLLTVGISALRQAVDCYSKMTTALLERNQQLENAHVEMMRASAGYYIRGVETEAELVKERALREAETGEKKDEITQLAEQLMPFIMAKIGGGGPVGGG